MSAGPRSSPGDNDQNGLRDRLKQLRQANHPVVRFFREFLASTFMVIMVGVLLFGVSGVWPPLVAVESGSMTPNLHRGDLVFVMDESRFQPQHAVNDTGIVTYYGADGSGYRSFGDYGDVIVFSPNGGNQTPIIHRARFWVQSGENWYQTANKSFIRGDSCAAIPNCPAPHGGFITKGDANGYYDQVSGISAPVKLKWVRGTAKLRIPFLGHIRLQFSTITDPRPIVIGQP